MSANEPRRIARRREPMFNAPIVVLGLIAVLIGIYAAFNWAPVAIQDRVIRDYAFIPGRLTIAIWPDRLIDLLKRVNTDPAALQQARQIRELHVLDGGAKPWTVLTYAFMHGSWTHVLLNSVWLGAFGPPIARRFGSARFLLFMAAATRFMFQPGAPLGAFGSTSRPEIESVPAASLSGVFMERRSLIFIVIWFGTNLIFGAGAQTLGFSDMPVAWIAHLGGFIAGLVLFPLFDRPFRAPPMAGELAPDPRSMEA
jgi:membrane associated rhomboid family serine protease